MPIIKNACPTLVLSNMTSGIHPPGSAKTLFTSKFNWTHKYYNKKYWPHQYVVERNINKEVERWCWSQFNGWRWHSERGMFVFKRADDAILFKLRWANKVL